jgi:hypothetical protein
MYIEDALLALSLEGAGRIPKHLRRLREDVVHFDERGGCTARGGAAAR